MGFLYAECLFEMKEYEQAATAYEKISKIPEYNTYREKAAAKRIQCLETERPASGKPADELLEAYRDYVLLNPHSEAAPLLLSRQGEILFNAGRYSEAREVFASIIDRYPTETRHCARAWMLLLECYFEEKDFPAIERLATTLQERPLVLDPEQKARMLHLLRLAQFAQARASEDAGDVEQAAQRYRRIATEAPNTDIAPDALYNAALCFQRAGDMDSAVVALDDLVRTYPNSKPSKDALEFLIPYHEKKEQWDRLSVALDALYRIDHSSSLAQESLYRAAKKLLQAGKIQEALALFSTYRTRYPQDHKRRLEFDFLEAKAEEQRGHTDAARKKYALLLKDVEMARKTSPSLEVDSFQMAQARFALLEGDLHVYKKIKLVEPLQENLKKKQALYDTLIAGYLETIGYGVPELSIGSGYRIGEIYEEFGSSLVDSEIPRGLNEEEVKAYSELLRQKALPFYDQAKEAYKTTLERAAERGVFTPWAIKAYSQLSKLDPAHYPSLLQEARCCNDAIQGSHTLIEHIDKDALRAFSIRKVTRLEKSLAKALRELKEAYADPPVSPRVLEHTISRLTPLAEKEPSLYEVHFTLGVLYELREDPQRALEAYRRALDANPKLIPAYVNMATLYMAQNAYAEAERILTRVLPLDDKNAQALYLRGLCRAKRDDYAGAISSLQAAAMYTDSVEPHIEMVRIYHNLGAPEKAKTHIRHVLDTPDADPSSLRKLACVLMDTEQPEMALDVYDKISASGKETFDDVNNRGIVLLRSGKPAEAQQYFTKALELDPDRPEAYNNLGLVSFRLQRYKEAASFFEKAYAAQEGFLIGLLNAGIVYGGWLEEMETALGYLQNYLEAGGQHHASLLSKWISTVSGLHQDEQ